jgi:SAM-dependent methyltransferase
VLPLGGDRGLAVQVDDDQVRVRAHLDGAFAGVQDGTAIDFDSTLVGGSEDLVSAILAAPGLEVWPVDQDNGRMTSGEPAVAAMRDARYFDAWYADMATSPARDAIVARILGLPPELQSTSLLSWRGIAEVTEKLRMPQDGVLLDMACGRGGYGIEVARRTGARLLGVDLSRVAVEQATSNGARLLPAGRSEFRIGSLLAAGLPTGVADGLMCVDAVQFAEPPLAALLEFRRLLRSGGRLAVTCWEAVDPSDERVLPRIHGVNLRRDLPEAGFVEVEVHDKPEWRRAERAMWEEAVAVVDSDAAVRSLQAEGRRSLDTFGSLRRVFATATAP